MVGDGVVPGIGIGVILGIGVRIGDSDNDGDGELARLGEHELSGVLFIPTPTATSCWKNSSSCPRLDVEVFLVHLDREVFHRKEEALVMAMALISISIAPGCLLLQFAFLLIGTNDGTNRAARARRQGRQAQIMATFNSIILFLLVSIFFGSISWVGDQVVRFWARGRRALIE